MVDHSLVFVAHVNPCLDPVFGPDDVLGELTEAFDKEFMPEYNSCGGGSFRINTNSEQYDWCAQANYVRVYRDDVGGDLLGGFVIESSGHVAVSRDEEGGEVAQLAGRGPLSILFWAVMSNVSALGTELANVSVPANDPDGMWHWTDRPPGAILVRQLEEAQARGSPDPVANSAIPPVTWDFTRDVDSNGDAWTTSAGDLFKVAVGTHLFRGNDEGLIQILQDVGLIVHMDGDFNLFAWDTDQGDDLTGSINFTKGENIRGDADTDVEYTFQRTLSTILIQGDVDGGDLIYVNVDGLDGVDLEALYGRREGFLPYPHTPTTSKLTRYGVKALNRAYQHYLGIASVPVLERDDEIPLLHYFPGDTVTVLGLDRRIRKIRFFDRDNGEYDVDLQFDEPDRAGAE